MIRKKANQSTIHSKRGSTANLDISRRSISSANTVSKHDRSRSYH
jgi:hypothetical protein